MNRQEAEAAILEHLKAVSEILKEYGCPSGKLSISVHVDDSYISFFNSCWDGGEDELKPIQYYEFEDERGNNA